jgi:hypothetical protein
MMKTNGIGSAYMTQSNRKQGEPIESDFIHSLEEEEIEAKNNLTTTMGLGPDTSSFNTGISFHLP